MSVFGFIGVGNMGGALARAVAKNISPENIMVSDYDSEKAKSVADELGAVVSDNAAIAEKADCIFIGVKPQVIEAVLGSIAPTLSQRDSRFVFISMAAGVSIENVQKYSGGKYPVIRIMPNLPVQVREGAILYTPSDETCDRDEKNFLQALDGCGSLIKLKEDLINVGMAVSGCGPAFVDLFTEAMADGAVACGLPRNIAQQLAVQTIKGSAVLAQKTGKNPAVLKDEVCSPGGTTIQGVRKLEESGFRAAVMNAVIAAYEKNFNL